MSILALYFFSLCHFLQIIDLFAVQAASLIFKGTARYSYIFITVVSVVNALQSHSVCIKLPVWVLHLQHVEGEEGNILEGLYGVKYQRVNIFWGVFPVLIA